MVESDLTYIRSLIKTGVISGDVLELGSYNHAGGDGGNTKATCVEHGLSWQGTDLEAGLGVDIVLDILDGNAVNNIERRWHSVLVPNLLEHVYDPITALAHALQLTRHGGVCVVVGPTVWQLHDYPADYWRPMPDFFTELARRHGCEIISGSAMFLLDKEKRIIPVESLRIGAQKKLPSKDVGGEVYGRWRTVRSRAVHFIWHTIGRDTYFPCVGLGIALRRL